MKTKTTRTAKVKDRHKNPREVFHLPPWLQSGIDRFIRQCDPQPTKSAAFRRLIQEGLRRFGIDARDPAENGRARKMIS